MTKNNEIAIAGQSFEDLKHINEHDAEYWSALALQAVFEYGQWWRFEQAIGRAKISCNESGNPPTDKLVDLGSGSVREIAA